MKKILLLGILFYFLAVPNSVSAQGTFICQQPSPGVPGTCVASCESGYTANCQNNSDGKCYGPIDGPKPCVPELVGKNQGRDCISTGIGCIPFDDPNSIAAFFLRWGLGIAGGIAILLIIVASFIITTSSGDPKKVQGGKELLMAAIGGVILIIFSTFILQFIGVKILNIF